MTIRIGVDTGGTFTDLVVLSDGQITVHKVLSTPEAPERAILQGLKDLGVLGQAADITHGSTVATNAVLEGKTARTAFVTNRGFRDLLTIGRQARRHLFDLYPARPAPPVPDALCFETGGRVAADASVIDPLTESDLQALRAAVAASEVEAVAVNLLFSFLNPEAEQRIKAALSDFAFVAVSCEVLPEVREYERGIATWLNAAVGPVMSRYLAVLQERVAPAALSIMQSSGGCVDASVAGRLGVNMLLSGPAGGLLGAHWLGQRAGFSRLMTFDMGGTSTDVALIDGNVPMSQDGVVAGYPVVVPMVDMHTVGAGGGSIAQIDAGGLLQVGPQSAGADPGPACYGRGGEAATVTDANVVLGRLPSSAALGGGLPLDSEASRRVIQPLAERLGVSVEAAARGIVDTANERMVQALRVISVERGYDPAAFVLMPFGGAGGLHVCALADALGMRRALLPAHAGVLSAFGMITAPTARHYSQALSGPLDVGVASAIETAVAVLRVRAEHDFLRQSSALVDVDSQLDLRYPGQSSCFTIPWCECVATVAEAFHAAHERAFGHRLMQSPEVVNVRVVARGRTPEVSFAQESAIIDRDQDLVHSTVYGYGGVPVYRRERLTAGRRIDGPAIICEKISTAWVSHGWCAVVDDFGNMLFERDSTI